jgi:uncharacterized protein YecT (DUF1311 family)
MKLSTKLCLAAFALAFGSIANASTTPAAAATAAASSGDKCMDNAQSQAAMDACASQSLAVADKELNQIYQYGSVYPMCANNELEAMTRKRIEELRAWLKGTQEGDVCAGSYQINT